jgi:hypothetical protein
MSAAEERAVSTALGRWNGLNFFKRTLEYELEPWNLMAIALNILTQRRLFSSMAPRRELEP